MIFGQPSLPNQRIPFQRPSAASYYTPGLPRTGFYSHLWPFMSSTMPMNSYQANVGPMPPDMNPGSLRVVDPSRSGVRQQLPAVSTPTPAAPGGMAGFGHPSFGAFRGGVSPYKVMRTGALPGIKSAGTNIRGRIQNAPQFIKSLTPGAFPGANVPGGGYGV